MANRIDPNSPDTFAPEENPADALDELVSAIIEHDPLLTDLLGAIAEGTESKSKLITRIQAWSEQMGGCTKEQLEPAHAGKEIPNWMG